MRRGRCATDGATVFSILRIAERGRLSRLGTAAIFLTLEAVPLQDIIMLTTMIATFNNL